MPGLFEPDFTRFRKVLMRQGEPDRVPFYELFADVEIMSAVLGRPVQTPEDQIAYQVKLGYDYAVARAGKLDFPTTGQQSAADTAELARAKRTFNVGGQGVIKSWEDFEKYPWPDPQKADYSQFEQMARAMPDGMKLVSLAGHVLEMPMAIMGYDALCALSCDEPDLIAAVFQRVGETYISYYKTLASMDCVGALIISDDLGFKTQPLMSPAFLKQHVFPWYKRYCDICHAANKPVILHSCGCLELVMDEIIACGIDAKHSYEDVILPVEQAKKRYGDRVAILGGLDVDFLCRSTPEQVRVRTREVLEKCMPGGGYALGTGNTVANYIPVENFLAMIEVGRKVGVYGR
ncbi:MAG TPA: uroporphyrinogen decarboxylase family protein [Planctomycetota bacterium]|jgi:uroporphyrinogen decarboxylase